MENGPFIEDFPIKTSIYKGFSMAMLNNQMVICPMSMDNPNFNTVFGKYEKHHRTKWVIFQTQ
jgi:tetrahydromethanopterin S-methyltransferase subunit C